MLGLAVVASALGGCGGGDPEGTLTTSHKCVDDSVGCIAHRQSTLKTLLADRDKRWIHEPATADAYAGGVRLFAFKQRKRELTCNELALGRREADAGPGVLRGPGGRHLTPAQISRGVMFAGEVSRELGNEMKRRCAA